jgi:hypothetical protein
MMSLFAEGFRGIGARPSHPTDSGPMSLFNTIGATQHQA